MVRWGLLGTARITKAVIPPIRASKRNRLVGVASRTMARAEEHAQEWSIDRTFGSYEAMLADSEIDAVYIALPNSLHAEWTIKAVEAGKHVLCEKPLGLSRGEVDAMTEAAHRRQRVVAEAFMYRHHPQTDLVQRLIREGAIGDIRVIRGAFTFALTRTGDVRWSPAFGGGSLWDVGCYPVSFARLLVGREPIDVRGVQVLAQSGVDVSFAGLLLFPRGILATFDSSFAAPLETFVEVVGSAGMIRIPAPFKPGAGALIDLVDAAGACRTISAGTQDLYSGEIEDMAAAILDGTPPRVRLSDSRGNAATIAALYESARLGQSVSVQV